VEEGRESGDEGGGDELVGEIKEVMCLRKRGLGEWGVRGDGGSHRRSVSGVYVVKIGYLVRFVLKSRRRKRVRWTKINTEQNCCAEEIKLYQGDKSSKRG